MLWDHHKVGFLDEMFDIFDSFHHPVVLVGDEAMRWMAVGLWTGQGIDLLVRTGQHSTIVQSLLASGCWVGADHEEGDFAEAIRQAAIPRFKRVGEEFYITLWPENVFGLVVDGDLCQVPHVCCWNAVLVESQFYPHPTHNQTYPRLLSDDDARFTPKNPDQSPPPIRPQQTPVYIPTIPRYVDACLYRSRRLQHLPDAPRFTGSSDMDISYLIRYLFLEKDAQRTKLLPMLSAPRQSTMRDILDRYKRTVKANLRFRYSGGMLTSTPETGSGALN